jgi:hypothetical protein
MQGLIAIGADVSNAFAEAPPPQAPLYMYIDKAFRDWWTNHKSRTKIPKECNFIQVCKAIQGHPESPRLWEKHIDRILREMGFTPTHHEPCLYSSTVKGNLVLFLCQVDDFSVSASDEALCGRIITHINSKMMMDVKNLGIITRFNGMDVYQTNAYIKLSCGKYLTKMLTAHNWKHNRPPLLHPTPLPADNDYVKKLEQAIPPDNTTAKEALQHTMGFSYHQVMGEVI